MGVGMTIILKEIDNQNWKQCIKLKVRMDQQGFVASNLYSLAEAKFDTSLVPFPCQIQTLYRFLKNHIRSYLG